SPHRGAPVPGEESTGTVPTAPHPASSQAERSPPRAPVSTSSRIHGNAGTGARPQQALPDGRRVCPRVLRCRAGRAEQATRLLRRALPEGGRVTDQEALRRLLLQRSVQQGDFVLASGRRSSFYIDCRLTTMPAEGMVIIGRMGLAAIEGAGWAPQAVGGLTLGADPVAYAIAAASFLNRTAATSLVDAFTVRKEA